MSVGTVGLKGKGKIHSCVIFSQKSLNLARSAASAACVMIASSARLALRKNLLEERGTSSGQVVETCLT